MSCSFFLILFTGSSTTTIITQCTDRRTEILHEGNTILATEVNKFDRLYVRLKIDTVTVWVITSSCRVEIFVNTSWNQILRIWYTFS